MKSKVTLVITSFNRPDLLDKTINSVLWYSDYIFDDIIIIEDSGNKEMIEYFRLGYKAAILKNDYCIHTGIGRCTWNKNN